MAVGLRGCRESNCRPLGFSWSNSWVSSASFEEEVFDGDEWFDALSELVDTLTVICSSFCVKSSSSPEELMLCCSDGWRRVLGGVFPVRCCSSLRVARVGEVGVGFTLTWSESSARE